MKRVIQWHKDLCNDVADRFGLSAYQIMWVAAVKGLVIGYLAGAYL